MKARFMTGSNKAIFPIGLGCKQLTNTQAGSSDPTRQESLDLIEAAWNLGVNLFDTADFYGTYFGENEELLGRAFKQIAVNITDFREKCFITTKGGVEGIFESGVKINNTRDYLKNACYTSLQRLEVDYVDLYYLHRHDGKTSHESIIDTMAELISEGKIRAIGLSEVDPLFIAKAHQYANEQYGFGIAAIQPEYSIASREIEYSGILELCKRLNITVIPYGSICRGILTNGVDENHEAKGLEAILPRFNKDSLVNEISKRNVLSEIAIDLNCSESQLSLSWLLQQYNRIIPIPATTKLAHLQDNINAVNVNIKNSQLKLINENFPLNSFPLRYPQGFTETETDAYWIGKYNNIKEKSVKNKVMMTDIRNTVYTVIRDHLTKNISTDKLTALADSRINHSLIHTLQNRKIDMVEDGILGGSLAIYDGNKDDLLVGFSGQLDVNPMSHLINQDTRFNLGSISKFIMMVLTVRLCMLNKLDLDKSVEYYLSEIHEIPEAKQITLRHLLSHHSGLKTGFFKKYMKHQPLSDILLEERTGSPGNQFHYANINYVLLGRIIEAVTNDTLQNQFQKLIGEPLGLLNTYAADVDTTEDKLLADGCKYTGTSKIYKLDHDNFVWAASGFRSNPRDLVKLSYHFFNDSSFIDNAWRQEILNSYKNVEFKVITKNDVHKWPAVYGLGIERHVICDPRDDNQSLTLYANGGWRNGSSIYLAYEPENKIAVCYACTKTQGALKLNLSKLTSGHFYKPEKKIDECNTKNVFVLTFL